MVSEFMHTSPAKLILLSLCFQGLTLVPAFAQVAPADGRVGTPLNAPIASTVATATVPTVPSAAPINVTSYILGPEDLITVRVFAADDIPDKPVQIDNDGTVTLPMIGRVHAAGLTVEQFQANLITAYVISVRETLRGHHDFHALLECWAAKWYRIPPLA